MKLEPLIAYQLHSMGLVALTGNRAQPRFQVYHQYFYDLLQKT